MHRTSEDQNKIAQIAGTRYFSLKSTKKILELCGILQVYDIASELNGAQDLRHP